MPVRVDVEERVAIVTAACLRILERDGLVALSVRNVADEAGIAAASLRRLFPTQDALREHCLTIIEERVTARLSALRSTGRALAVDILAQVLPLDAERTTEILAQVQLGVLSRTDEHLTESARRLNDGVGRVCARALDALGAVDALDPERDRIDETDRLHALVDGLAVEHTWDPAARTPARVLSLVELHLDGLGAPRS
ncbi:TetR family transcriptional regulator C-terminal domain-containing protein [Curtobacterium sp. MCJR17_020]|uniref:TetR/AcrR family transcriptional regulator n=1 Tax=Curtobacterium sp. MCJR17_020 TaxID=2175619 RepID=UPI000DA9FD33|nr:TetR family transcriptional regulator C-terminal domain-containing protein [Curtobacterium sp. MCJR17_020]WIE71991.1 TetR family transcriptional regulator C-terminal domain-containing protein [Curtobacterium sp. MCJR17_020]